MKLLEVMDPANQIRRKFEEIIFRHLDWEHLADRGIYGDIDEHDLEQAFNYWKQGDMIRVGQELTYGFATKDGGEPRSLEPIIDDMLDELNDLRKY